MYNSAGMWEEAHHLASKYMYWTNFVPAKIYAVTLGLGRATIDRLYCIASIERYSGIAVKRLSHPLNAVQWQRHCNHFVQACQDWPTAAPQWSLARLTVGNTGVICVPRQPERDEKLYRCPWRGHAWLRLSTPSKRRQPGHFQLQWKNWKPFKKIGVYVNGVILEKILTKFAL